MLLIVAAASWIAGLYLADFSWKRRGSARLLFLAASAFLAILYCAAAGLPCFPPWLWLCSVPGDAEGRVAR